MRPLRMVALVDEQAAAILLPIKEMAPDEVLLVHTRDTEAVARRLRCVVGSGRVHLARPVDPFDLPGVRARIVEEIRDRGWAASDLVFNATGGTKLMSMAAWDLAREQGYRVVYLQTGRDALLHQYRWDGSSAWGEIRPVAAEVTLDEHLRCYLGEYTSSSARDPFEEAVLDALERPTSPCDEILTSVCRPETGALEIDLVARRGHQVLIGEVKSKGTKKAIDQLSSAGQQRHLGTYVRRVLISGCPVESNNRALAEAYGVQVIEVGWDPDQGLSERDVERLRSQLWS